MLSDEHAVNRTTEGSSVFLFYMIQKRSWPVADLIKSNIYMYAYIRTFSVIVTRLQAGQPGI